MSQLKVLLTIVFFIGCGEENAKKSPENDQITLENPELKNEKLVLLELDHFSLEAQNQSTLTNPNQLNLVIHSEDQSYLNNIDLDTIQINAIMACCGSQAETDKLQITRTTDNQITIQNTLLRGKRGKWLVHVSFKTFDNKEIKLDFSYRNK